MKIKQFCKEKISDELVALIINKCLEVNELNRPTPSEVIQWIDEAEKNDFKEAKIYQTDNCNQTPS